MAWEEDAKASTGEFEEDEEGKASTCQKGDKDKEKVIQDDHVLVYDHQALT